MPSQITVTGKTGPAQTVTAAVIDNVISINAVAAPKSVLFVTSGNGKVQDFDLAATTTFTVTIAAGVMTVVISQ